MDGCLIRCRSSRADMGVLPLSSRPNSEAWLVGVAWLWEKVQCCGCVAVEQHDVVQSERLEAPSADVRLVGEHVHSC